jgi:hypothetical protein
LLIRESRENALVVLGKARDDGASKNSTIRFSKILAIVPYSDAVGIEKDAGRSPVFMVADADVLAVTVNVLLNKSNES